MTTGHSLPAQHDSRQTHLTELRGTCKIWRLWWKCLAVHVVSFRFVGTNHKISNQWNYDGWIRRNKTPNIEFREHRCCTALHILTEPRYSTALLCAAHQSFCVRDYSAAVSVADDKETSGGAKCVHITLWKVCTSQCEVCARHTKYTFIVRSVSAFVALFLFKRIKIR
jgi:hypothetical protein